MALVTGPLSRSKLFLHKSKLLFNQASTSKHIETSFMYMSFRSVMYCCPDLSPASLRAVATPYTVSLLSGNGWLVPAAWRANFIASFRLQLLNFSAELAKNFFLNLSTTVENFFELAMLI